MLHRLALLLVFVFTATVVRAVHVGAERLDQYMPLLQGKRVALLVNQTSRVGGALLPDTLLARGVRVVKLFVPEHGFRGTADAGAHVASGKDERTGLSIVSLYGANKKPTPAQMADVDILVYDLQDVGVRFYTYISTLQYALEACAARGIPLIVLDRPNPQGRRVAGPVLDTALRSFVGMQPIPILYGMTAGEYARMLVGERMFPGAAACKLTVIPCADYDGNERYDLPVPPSPNLRTPLAVQHYPWMCLFEGTVVSVGRGTDKPFEQWGHPAFKDQTRAGGRNSPGGEAFLGAVSFTPRSTVGASKPLLEGQTCYGLLVTGWPASPGYLTTPTAQKRMLSVDTGIAIRVWPLHWAYKWYQVSGSKPPFFNSFFEKLVGNHELRRQIERGIDPEEIYRSWAPAITRFKAVRKKYLLYPDAPVR